MIDISQDNLNIVLEILKKFVPNCEVRAFGSRYKWTAKDYSDLDLVIVGKNKLDWEIISDIKEDFQESDLTFRVDVIDWYAIEESFREVILKSGYELIFPIKEEILNIQFEYLTADNFCIKVTDGTDDSPKRTEKGKPLVTSKHIKGNNIDFSDTYLISLDDFNKINKRSKVEQWDVIISMIGEYCGYSYIEKNKFIDYAIKNVGLFKTGNRIKAFWLYYYLNSKTGKDILKNLRTGTSQPYITLKSLRNLLIPTTNNNLYIEKVISILSSLDEKIEINKQMNKTLEEMAQTIFKQWFVDFEFPLSASGLSELEDDQDFRGKTYKSSGGEMIDSELGEIPKGWECTILEDIIDVKGGTTPSTSVSEYWGGDFFWTTPKDLSNNQSPLLLDTERKITQSGVKQISSGVLPKGTLLLSSRDPIGYLAISQVPISINQGYIAINGKKASNLFILFWIKENMDVIKSRANDSTFQEISKSNFKQIKIILPKKNILINFDQIVSTIFEQIVVCEMESKILTQIRDSLLPKLISGKLSVS